jgi:hypothetical protein
MGAERTTTFHILMFSLAVRADHDETVYARRAAVARTDLRMLPVICLLMAICCVVSLNALTNNLLVSRREHLRIRWDAEIYPMADLESVMVPEGSVQYERCVSISNVIDNFLIGSEKFRRVGALSSHDHLSKGLIREILVWEEGVV